MTSRILVIKLSALGDVILSIAAFQAIRAQHPAAAITLLTTAPYSALARASGLFDDAWVDERAPLWRIDRWLALAARLRGGQFERVYDLQRSQRSAAYYRLFATPKPEWVGTHRWASHRYQQPRDQVLHIVEREAQQLALAGIEITKAADLSFLKADMARLNLPRPYALLVPGGSAHRPEKRWPAPKYAKLAASLAFRGIIPYLIGHDHERETLKTIEDTCPKTLNLCGDTGFEDLASLARDAVVAVGNDTGPMHLFAAAGCPCLSLFSAASDPRKTAPRGAQVRVLQADDLDQLALGDVLRELKAFTPPILVDATE